MDADAQSYIDAIDPRNRPLFDRFHDLISTTFPDVEVLFSYKMPTYKVGKNRLYLGVWNHGVSFYGGTVGEDSAFTERHPKMRTGKGTIRVSHDDAAAISDDEFLQLITASLTKA